MGLRALDLALSRTVHSPAPGWMTGATMAVGILNRWPAPARSIQGPY